MLGVESGYVFAIAVRGSSLEQTACAGASRNLAARPNRLPVRSRFFEPGGRPLNLGFLCFGPRFSERLISLGIVRSTLALDLRPAVLRRTMEDPSACSCFPLADHACASLNSASAVRSMVRLQQPADRTMYLGRPALRQQPRRRPASSHRASRSRGPGIFPENSACKECPHPACPTHSTHRMSK
jgi:hypothetical protein